MYSPNVVPPFSFRKCGNTSSRTTSKHLLRAFVPEVRPAERAAPWPGKAALNGFFVRSRASRSGRLGDVEQPREHQERDLLDDRQRVGDAAGPELFPELVDVALQLVVR